MVLRIKSLAAFLILALGAWFCVQALAPQIQSLLGGSWLVMLIIGIVFIAVASYLGRRP